MGAPAERERLNPLSDTELIAAINEGDESAFEALYCRHREWVVNLAYRWTGDRDLALDVLQETFLYFSKKFPGFSLTAKIQTFFYPVVRNLSIAARRNLERFETGETAEQTLSTLPSESPAPDVREQLQAVLSGLGEDHREVLFLRFVDGLSLAEVAAAIGIPLGTVKSRLHNALDHLRHDPRTRSLIDENFP